MKDSLHHAPVLLVEDDENDIVLIQRAIQRAGARVDLHFVRDGEQAIMYLSGAGPYSDRERHAIPILTLLDLKLPRRSGFEVLQWMRSQPELTGIPVIVLTSSMEPADITTASSLGANACLSKPAIFDSLADVMKALDTYWMRLRDRREEGGTE